MAFTKQQIWTAILLGFSGIGTAITIALGVPQLIAQHAHQIPKWITDPNTLWIASIAFVTTIGILFILAPWKRAAAARTAISNTLDLLLMDKIHSILLFQQDVLKTGNLALVDRTILHSVDYEIPTYLRSAIGKSESDRYLSAIKAARHGPKMNSMDLFRVAMSHIEGIIAKQVIIRVERLSEEIAKLTNGG